MEIKVNIPQNDYVQPTEVREEVVQAICTAFLKKTCWSTFYPFSGSNNGCRRATLDIDIAEPSFGSPHEKTETTKRIHGVEMKAAFEALIKAGYHMYVVYDFGYWKGYVCDKKPFYKKGTEVTSFNDFID